MSYSAFPANIWLLIRCSKKLYFTPQKHTITKHVHIHFRTRPWLIRNQWSMVNTIFDTLKWNQMDLYNQHPIPTVYSHAAQKVGLNSFPVKLPSTFPTLPTSSLWGFSGSSDLPSLVSSASYGMVADLIWSRCRVKTKESGRSNWAAGGRKSQCSANGEGFCGCDTILFFFPCQNRFVIAFLWMAFR